MVKPWRETPLVESPTLSKAAGCRIFLKLENLQPSGSFKSRGIGNYLISHLANSKPLTPESTHGANTPTDGSLSQRNPTVHFYCSSGGNAGLACATAAAQLRYPCTVVVPETTKQLMIDKIHAAGADSIIVHGLSWQEADAYLRTELLAKDPGGVYVPPFDHPDIWAGNATLVHEVAQQLADLARPDAQGGFEVNAMQQQQQQQLQHPYGATSMYRTSSCSTEPPDAIICSVGGGGLFNGVCQGITSSVLNPDVSSCLYRWEKTPVIAVETQGADSLASSVAASRHLTLDAITSQATSLGARRVSAQSYKLAMDSRLNVRNVVLTDAEAAGACVRFADEERIMVELACGVSVAMCYDEQRRLEQALRSMGRWRGADTKVVLVVCGGCVVTIDMLEKWRKMVPAHARFA